MTNESDAQLIFPEAYQPASFTNDTTTRQSGEADPVVRELLQNALDAAVREAHQQRAEVHFTISERPIEHMPGLKAYRQAFDAAATEIEAKKPTKENERVIGRIRKALDQGTMLALFCRDNGVGLNAKRMSDLLGEGASDKPDAGAGSYGLGHLTAFAASDLRYIMYGGRTADGSEIVSGHAMLAGHKINKERRAPHGYWKPERSVFTLEDGDFSSQRVALLEQELDHIRDAGSGSVIAILGFNSFRLSSRQEAFDAIARVAAANFMGSIMADRMVVHIHDETDGHRDTIDLDSIERHLKPKREEQVNRGWLPGRQAYRAYETMRDGKELPSTVDRSATIYFRALERSQNESIRVQLFRDGMWITNKVSHLQNADFPGVRKFDAVVMLEDFNPDDHTEFYDLARQAEGPEHRDLKKLGELPKPDQDALRAMFHKLAEQLKAEAGTYASGDSFESQIGAFELKGDRPIVLRPSPPLRPEPSIGDEEVVTPGGGGGGGRRGSETDRVAERRGLLVPVTVRRTANARGETSALRACVRLDEPPSGDEVQHLRVRAASGADTSCERPLAPTSIPIKSVRIGDGQKLTPGKEGSVELPPDAQLDDVHIELAHSFPGAAVFEVDVVRRKKTKSVKG